MHAYESIDKPLIGPRDAAPGRLAASNGRPVWSGEVAWETAHGKKARLLWVAGAVAGVFGAKLPNGGRAPRLEPGHPETQSWRRPMPNGSWEHGTLQITDDELTFVKRPGGYVAAKASGPMAASLTDSAEGREAVANRSFAADLYGALANSLWKNRSGKEFNGRWDKAGEIVAEMRRLNEIAPDFFHEGTEGYVSEEAAELLGSLGWRIEGQMGTVESRNARAETLVKLCEDRDWGPMPDWYAHWITGASDDDTLFGRIHTAAFSGKVSYKEWTTFWEFVNLDA